MKRTIIFLSALLLGLQVLAYEGGYANRPSPYKKGYNGTTNTTTVATPTYYAPKSNATPSTLPNINSYTQSINYTSTSSAKDMVASDFRQCKPYRETANINMNGMSMEFSLSVDGWQNGKCVYNIGTRINSLGDLRNMAQVPSEITDAQISKLAPVIQCHFDPSQLNTIVNMMEKGGGASAIDSEAFAKYYEDGVCTIVNQEEIMQGFGVSR